MEGDKKLFDARPLFLSVRAFFAFFLVDYVATKAHVISSCGKMTTVCSVGCIVYVREA